MTGRCRRLWEVEAARDGRLTGHALLAFEQHANTCRDCAQERAALEGLRKGLVTAAPPTDEVFLRRERDRLLAAADALGRSHSARPAYVRWAAAFAALMVVTATTWLGVRAGSVTPQNDSYARITPSAGARWERHRRTGVDEIELVDGKLSFAVHRSDSDPRISVHVPDGEIEDLGTEFYVIVRERRTQEIAVQSGAVVFHPRGRAAELVTSGSIWKPAPASAPPVEPTAFSTAAPPHAPPVTHSPRGTAHAVTHAAPRPSPSHAPDASAEDEAFLRILTLRRAHRTEEARAAAAKYLDAFPSGFRRAEVLRFVLAPH